MPSMRTRSTPPALLAALLLCGSAQAPANGALEFQRSVVQVPDALPLNLQGTWTLEAWIRPGVYDSTRLQTTLGKYAAPDSVAYTLELRGRVLILRVSSGRRTQSVYSFPSIRPGVWQHVAATFRERTARLYVNGLVENVVGGIAPPRRSSGLLRIGNGVTPGTARGFDGAIDEVRIWALARTTSELNNTMRRRLGGNEPWLVGYWRFDDGSGDVLHDASRNANHGRLGLAVGPDAADPRWLPEGAPVR